MFEDQSSPELIGRRLSETILKVFEGVPGCSMRPTDLSRKLDISRVMVSRTISSIRKEDPVETLIGIPGPESLRTIIRSAKKKGASQEDTQGAHLAIDSFDELIRDQFGTRAALSAALSVKHAGTRDQFEQSSRFQVFKGMSQIMGVESKVWLTSTMYTPSKDDHTKYHVSSIFGPSGVRRLRPDTPIQLAFGVGPQGHGGGKMVGASTFDLTEFCANTPAPITVVEENGRIINTFAPDIGNKDSIYDMLAGVHLANTMDRTARASLTRRGLSVIPDIPVASLNIDMFLHKDIDMGSGPEPYVYNTRGNGKATFEDPDWNKNRMTTDDKVVHIAPGLAEIELSDIPMYPEMIHRMCEMNGHTMDEFRAYRLHVQYPVFGFQYVIAFKLPGR